MNDEVWFDIGAKIVALTETMVKQQGFYSIVDMRVKMLPCPVINALQFQLAHFRGT